MIQWGEERRRKMKKYTMLMAVIWAMGFALLTTASYAASMGGQSGWGPMAGWFGSSKSEEASFQERASRMIGAEVRNNEGDYLGRITDLMVDPTDGKIAFAVISRGGVLGIAMRFVAVPFSDLTLGSTPKYERMKNVYVLDVSKEKLAAAPTFNRSQWPDVANRKWDAKVYKYYGNAPYWGENCE
jgi:sporulation protein YlmC with PRC-barrel domain